MRGRSDHPLPLATGGQGFGGEFAWRMDGNNRDPPMHNADIVRAITALDVAATLTVHRLGGIALRL